MPEIDDRSDITGLRQIVGIIVQLADVADQDAWKKFFTDVRSDDFVSDMDFVIRVCEFDEILGTLVDQPEIASDDTLV